MDDERSDARFRSSLASRAARADQIMVRVLAVEWPSLILTALFLSPGHLWMALLAGPCLLIPAICLAHFYPARVFPRHAVAVAQMLVSSLLIDFTRGRLETHFHILASLVLLGLYRDWRVLVTASAIAVSDHFFRGLWSPMTMYGVATVSPWRWAEHTWWIAFEDYVLIRGINTSRAEMRVIARHESSLYEQATHDLLTGLANRRFLQQRFDTIAGQPGHSCMALLFVDLDRFKQANDTLGHTVGDRILELVSARFRRAIPSHSTLARVGGDEFVILLETAAGSEEAEFWARRVVDCLRVPFHIDSHQPLLSASVGVSLYPEHGTTLAMLQERADWAMYLAKSRGRNQCVAFSDEVAQRKQMLQELANDLAIAMQRKEFRLHFQPLVRRDGSLTGFEALLRWNHPRYGAVSPTDFIPLAEQSGLILSLGDWILAEACRTCLTWQTEGQPRVRVAVNVSPVQFNQPEYFERLASILSRTGLDPTLLTLEITEGVLVRTGTEGRELLVRIRNMGVRIALDDFGTGYSSLSYLTDLPADQIKLDRTFLQHCSEGAMTVIGAVITLAHRLGLETVAEGVETSDQRDALARLQCDQFQGYYFSPPVSAANAAEMLGRIGVESNWEQSIHALVTRVVSAATEQAAV